MLAKRMTWRHAGHAVQPLTNMGWRHPCQWVVRLLAGGVHPAWEVKPRRSKTAPSDLDSTCRVAPQGVMHKQEVHGEYRGAFKGGPEKNREPASQQSSSYATGSG